MIHLFPAWRSLLVLLALGCGEGLSKSRSALHKQSWLEKLLTSRSGHRPQASNAAAVTRGFVICVSGPGRENNAVPDAVRTVAAIKSLRRAGNNDQVQVFHVDGELPKSQVKLLQQYQGVSVRDLRGSFDAQDLEAVHQDVRKYRSFDCKIEALLHSPFVHTMLIDSDTIFFKDPAQLFDSNTLKDTGTVFFYDRLARDSNPALMAADKKCRSIMSFAREPSVASALRPYLLLDFQRKHHSFCKGNTSHEQDSSMVLVDRSHPKAKRFLNMLKLFHTNYLMKNDDVKKWSFGEKEFFWISCELSGVHCTFSPRGRPMHIFFNNQAPYDDVDAPAADDNVGSASVIEDGGDALRPGCAAQLMLEGEQDDLLYANLSDRYCDWDKKLNAVTVWNPDNIEPRVIQGSFWLLRTGKGTRPLSYQEQAVTDAYRDDIARLEKLKP